MFSVAVLKPSTLKEMWEIVSQADKPRKYLAGGTDLSVNASSSYRISYNWIDISDLSELKGIRETKKMVYIGAGVKIADLGESLIIKKWVPVLYEAVPQFASPSLRNMATLGGNCANASPCADGICALTAQGTVAVISLYGKTKHVPIEKLFSGPKKTILKEDELILGFEIAKTIHKGVYRKLAARSTFAISKVSLGVSMQKEKGRIKEIKIALGSVGPTVLRGYMTEKFLCGKKPDKTVISKAKEIIAKEAVSIDDHRSVAEYRNAMTAVLLGRCLDKLV